MYACACPLSRILWWPQQKEITVALNTHLLYSLLDKAHEKQYPTPAQSNPKPTESVDHPPHYVSHPSGIECIQITEHMGFNLGNAFKYIWRAELKGSTVEDLKKARWYLDREIQKRERAPNAT